MDLLARKGGASHLATLERLAAQRRTSTDVTGRSDGDATDEQERAGVNNGAQDSDVQMAAVAAKVPRRTLPITAEVARAIFLTRPQVLEMDPMRVMMSTHACARAVTHNMTFLRQGQARDAWITTSKDTAAEYSQYGVFESRRKRSTSSLCAATCGRNMADNSAISFLCVCLCLSVACLSVACRVHVSQISPQAVRGIWNRQSWGAATRSFWNEDDMAQWQLQVSVKAKGAPAVKRKKPNMPSAKKKASGIPKEYPSGMKDCPQCKVCVFVLASPCACSMYLFACLLTSDSVSVCLPACLSVCRCVCLHVCMFVCVGVYGSGLAPGHTHPHVYTQLSRCIQQAYPRSAYTLGGWGGRGWSVPLSTHSNVNYQNPVLISEQARVLISV